MMKKQAVIFIFLLFFGHKTIVCAQEINVYSGNIDKDTLTWSADTIIINGDLFLKDSTMITISPGVKVLFTGPYEVKCTGTIRALGTRENPILFSCTDTNGFYKNDVNEGGWKGLSFSENRSSYTDLSYCILEHAKKVTGPYGINGGAIRLNKYQNITINHCTIRNNKSGFGGAIFVEDANPVISHCKIYNNTGINAGGAIYCYNGQVQLSNSMISHNYSVDGAGIYLQECMHPSTIYNNTITENTASGISGGIYINGSENINIRNTIIYDNEQIDSKDIYLSNDTLNISVRSCDIPYDTSYSPIWRYISQIPEFVKNSEYDYRLNFGSPCIDMGSVILGEKSEFDIDGRLRVWDGNGDNSAVIDIGAYEFDSPIPPKIIYEVQNPESFEESNGYIDLSVLYGSPPFHFEWNSGDTTEDLHNLKAGLFIVKLTDSYNLKDSLTLVLDYINQSEFSITGTVITDYGFLKDGIVLSYKNVDSSFLFQKGSLVIDGKYHLNGLDNSDYVLFALPSIKAEQYFLPSFYYNKQLWEYSYQYNLIGRAFDVDFYLPLPDFRLGMNSISGLLKIQDTAYYEEKEELSPWFNYILPTTIENHIRSASDIPVILMKDGIAYNWTVTDTTGYFEFYNIPDGDYLVLAQVPGRPMIAPPVITLNIEHQWENSLKMLLRKKDIISYINNTKTDDLSGVKLYPNPVHDVLYIDLNIFQELSGIDIELFMRDGRLIKSSRINKSEETSIIEFDVTGIPAGIYLLKLKVNENLKFFKVLKK